MSRRQACIHAVCSHAIECMSNPYLLIDLPVAIGIEFLDHVEEFLLIDILINVSCNLLQVLQRYLPRRVLIKEREGLRHLLRGIALENLLDH